MAEPSKPTLQDLADKLDQLTTELDEVRRNPAQGQPWQDRTWDVVKWWGVLVRG